ncbi:MAG: sensor domain-containing diguanylate cyclase [Candidatus Izimaplasma sp.]|nr:sensor domain-containing diguanylate cyclase [Candidatus Izimaplasma bacterium]
MYKYDSDEFMKNLYEGVYIVDKNRKIIFWNSGSESITGYKSSEVFNSHCYQNILKHVDKTGKKLCFEGCPLQNTIETGNINENDVFLEHKNGHRVPVAVKTFPLYDDDGKIVAAVEVFTDSRFKEIQYYENQRLKKIIQIDPLTTLFNRRYLEIQLKNIRVEANEFASTFGILFFDIDHFKNVNDQYGHNVGDGVLKVISKTLKTNLRPEDIVGRWGGEEFIAIVKTSDVSILEEVADRIRKLCENSSYKSKNKVIQVTISVGGTLYKPKETIKSVISRADEAMYESKETGRNKVTIK